jgi:hypothetical protein
MPLILRTTKYNTVPSLIWLDPDQELEMLHRMANFYPVGDSHLPSPYDEFLPNSTLILGSRLGSHCSLARGGFLLKVTTVRNGSFFAAHHNPPGVRLVPILALIIVH